VPIRHALEAFFLFIFQDRFERRKTLIEAADFEQFFE
jgi:hypothetical protein